MSGVADVLVLQLSEFLENPGVAPPTLERAIQSLPPGFTSVVAEFVPVLAWPLWIIVGAAIGINHLFNICSANESVDPVAQPHR